MKAENEKELWISCDCKEEGVLFTHFRIDTSEKYPEEDFYLAIYNHGHKKKPSLKQRLKYCWYHLTTGKKYNDQIIIRPKEAKQIADWINEELNASNE